MLRGYLFVDHLPVFVQSVWFFNSVSKITCAMLICLPMDAVLQELPVSWFSAYEIGLSGLPGDQFVLNWWRYRYSPRWTCPMCLHTPAHKDLGSRSSTALPVHCGFRDAPWEPWPLPSTGSFRIKPPWLGTTWPPETPIMWAVWSQILLFQSNTKIQPV